MTLTYHDEKVGTIRYAVLSDCEIIGNNMRAQDALEMWCFDRSRPTEATIKSFSRSIIAMTIEHDGKPIAMFGIIPHDMASGMLWLIGTDDLNNNNFGGPFVRNCRKWFNAMVEIYSKLYGMVDKRNEESIRWLTYIGVTWGNDITAGIDNMPFKTFKFTKE